MTWPRAERSRASRSDLQARAVVEELRQVLQRLREDIPIVPFQPALIAQTIEQIAKDGFVGMLLHPGMPRELPMPEDLRPRLVARLNPLLRIEVQQLGRRLYGLRDEMLCHLRHPS